MSGITAPSFYAAFGSKEELFREAVVRPLLTASPSHSVPPRERTSLPSNFNFRFVYGPLKARGQRAGSPMEIFQRPLHDSR
jgi:hypothetical protein